ncbi:MAG: Carbon-nitrogen hydrolase [Alyxoria varia]|nr:MAG: Carbon-nitrogen hydrolase [Alyxoria varia]
MAHNLQLCRELVSKAVDAGAKALFLPEATDYIASSAEESSALAQPLRTSLFVQGIREEARKSRLGISVGVHEPGEEPFGSTDSAVENAIGGPRSAKDSTGNENSSAASTQAEASKLKKVKNTLIWIDQAGTVTNEYNKLHLFDVDIEGGPVIRESRSTEKGAKILPPYRTPIGQVGSLICFDLRFPQPSISLSHQGATTLLYPSAFSIPTGRAGHWDTLLKARAIESQCFVIAAAQAGHHNDKRASYGGSMIIGPWGDVKAKLPVFEENNADEQQHGNAWPSIAVADIDVQEVESVRQRMPLLPRIYFEVISPPEKTHVAFKISTMLLREPIDPFDTIGDIARTMIRSARNPFLSTVASVTALPTPTRETVIRSPSRNGLLVCTRKQR